jgi:hypothetical protein
MTTRRGYDLLGADANGVVNNQFVRGRKPSVALEQRDCRLGLPRLTARTGRFGDATGNAVTDGGPFGARER